MKKQENIESKILKLFGNKVDKTFNFEAIKHFLPQKTRKEKIIHSLDILKRQQKLIEVDRFVFQLNPSYDNSSYKELDKKPKTRKDAKLVPEPSIESKSKFIHTADNKNEEGIYIGTLDITFSGAMFVKIPELDRDPIVRDRDVKAMDGDTLKVKVKPTSKPGRRAECTVLEIITRKSKQFIGQVRNMQNKGNENTFVTPVSSKMKNDFYISQHVNLQAKNDDFVIVEFLSWYDGEKNPRGKIIEILHNYNPNEIEMQTILLDKGFRQEFDPKIIEEVQKIPSKIPASEIKNRIDFRSIFTLTIDPHDAKDFDDAISYQILPNGNYQLGVHIADVSHYVQPNTLVDKEAFYRATSVYLPDRVAPMIPERLSNDLCSLRPNVDRLAFSVVYEVNDLGEIVDEKVGRTIINSNQRFTYEEAQEIIESGKGKYCEEILTLDRIAKIWRKSRYEKGAISFHTKEIRFNLDEQGVPIDVYQKVQKDAHLLIEDFMLKANVSLAIYLSKMTKEKKIVAGVYRDHDLPNLEKLVQFREAAKRLGGHKVPKFESLEKSSIVLNDFLESIQGTSEADILNQMAIRTMAKAYYSSKNIGHFGLGYEFYTHFTSPIRRYPDLMVHRLIGSIIDQEKLPYSKEKIEEICVHCSEQERAATECERDGIKFKQVEFLSTRIGEKYAGLISGVNQTGFWVEIEENKCEGYVEINENFEENFTYDPANISLKSVPSKYSFFYGDAVEIIVSKVDLKTKKVWFRYV